MPDQLTAAKVESPVPRPEAPGPDGGERVDSPHPGPRPHPAHRLWHLAVIVLGMSGLRLDRRSWRTSFLVWVIGWAACLSLYTAVFQRAVFAGGEHLARWSIIYLGAVCVAYYGGLSLVLGTPLRRKIITSFGTLRGWAAVESVLGIVFLNQALCQTAIMEQHAARLPQIVPPWVYQAAGASLVVIGLVCKIWATWLTGLDTYYYRDMFRGRASGGTNGGFVVRGPYRLMSNPMYGVGNLTAYGGALWYNSWVGLGVAALMQALIFLFYGLFERPFIKRTYLSNDA